jgi:glutamyl-tRNA synthetase
MTLLGEVVGMLGFLFTADDELTVADDARAALREESASVLDAAAAVLGDLPEFTTAATQEALQAALVDEGGLAIKPRFAYTPLRVAVTGRRVSPPLFESMELLGRESTLARIAALRATL